MIKFFVKAWDKNKGKLEKYFRENDKSEYCNTYEDLFKIIIREVLNDYTYDVIFDDNVEAIYEDPYQGTLLINFSQKSQSTKDNEKFYTTVSYGSCYVCDVLMGIYEERDEEQRIKDCMTLCLHLIQNIKCYGDLNQNSYLKRSNSMGTTVEGILELVTSLTPGGENVYGINVDTRNPGENLYTLFGNYEGKKVRLYIEEIEEYNEEIIPRKPRTKVNTNTNIIAKGRKITKFYQED